VIRVKINKELVIVGGGTAGWLAAAAFGKMLKDQVNVTIIESDDIPTIGVGEATIPPLTAFHKLLGIDERDFLKATNGTYKLGIAFKGWGAEDSDYFHSFGSTGKGFWAGDFHHLWLRGLKYDINQTFAEYAFETQAAYAGKFTKDTNPKLNYAYHFDAGLYANFLRNFSGRCGVKRYEGMVKHVDQNAESGDITAVRLSTGLKIKGDFFIDCSGFRGLLIEKTLNAGYEDWSQWLLCDRAVAMQTTLVDSPKPYTESTAYESGWRWRIPLQNRVGNGIVYSSQFWTDETANNILLADTNGDPINNPRIIQFKPGRRRQGWKNNCVALGLASGFIEPLESTSIHLIMTGIMRLLLLYPYNGDFDSLRKEYNCQFQRELEDIRDFIIAHYKINNRENSEFWRYCASMSVPDGLSQRINLFRDTAQIFKKSDELFRVDSWTQVMIGQGIVPRTYSFIADQMPEEELKQFLHGYHSRIKACVGALPCQRAFLNSYL
jgi:tryptophan halogenase